MLKRPEDLTTREHEIFEAITFRGSLRATKPRGDGEASYVWRMVAFQISSNPKHHCMPVTADFDMKLPYHERRERCKELDKLVDRIVRLVPMTQWHGINRWGHAFGF